MAPISLPLSFNNSFWSNDYRRGLRVLYDKLEQGVAENDEIVAFIRARAVAETNIANSLLNPPPTGRSTTGFAADDGASLLMAFRGLQAESQAQGQAHSTVAKELATLVADPFNQWAQGYKERVKQNKATVVDDWLYSYEQDQAEVAKLKGQYLVRVRKADEAEDDAKFAPTAPGDKFTNSPRLRPSDSPRAPPQRTASVSERITQRIKEIQRRSVEAVSSVSLSDDGAATPPSPDEKPLPKVDKGKGREVITEEPEELASPLPMSPLPPPKDLPAVQPPILLAGLAFTPAMVSDLLTRAANELPLRPVRFPLIGEYQDTFTGDEFVAWLVERVEGFDRNLDRAEEAAKELTENQNLLRRLGELGNQFEPSDDAFYQFRPKAFELGKNDSDPSPQNKPADILKRTGNFATLVNKVLNTNTNGEPPYVRARREAEEADNAYRTAVRRLDRHRLSLEQHIEDTLKLLQRWETERLRAVKTVLLQYHGTLSNLPKSFEASLERSGTLIAAYQPDQDLNALIERYRTGPFRPNPQVYESVAHDESDVVFGIDLRKWAEGGWYAIANGEEKKETIPPVLTALLQGLVEAYGRIPDDAEKRKSWIYEVPLVAVHQLREALNAVPPNQPFPPELLAKFDAPVIASCLKLWALELNPPLGLYEGWDEFRKLYPTVGSSSKGTEEPEQERLQTVSNALQRLPRVHLYALDAIIKHLRDLAMSTQVEEGIEIYFTKVALSMGRCIIRPKAETELSVQDRHPTALLLDLLNNYDALLPTAIARKKRESERKVPIRKRTAPIDMRLSRSRISMGADTQQLLAAEKMAQNPSIAKGIKSPELKSSAPPSAPSSLAAAAKKVESVPAPPPIEQTKTITPTPPPPPPVGATPVQKLATPSPPPTTAPALDKPFVPPPPPPAFQNIPPPPFLAPTQPQRPAFKEPPPELDDLPPRPNFKEPPPESETPERPNFADPPPEEESVPSPVPLPIPTPTPTAPPVTNVVPATPQKRGSVSSFTPKKVQSRSPSPPQNEDVVLGSGKASISRTGSAQSTTSVTRGPRLARGPRGQSGNVQNLVQNLNRNSVSGVSPPNSAGVTGPGSASSRAANRLSGSPVRRPSSVVGRSAAFSRRTMASDAEDDVVDRK